MFPWQVSSCYSLLEQTEPGTVAAPTKANTAFRREITEVKVVFPLQARSGPEGSRKLRIPDYMTTAQDGGKVVSLTHRPFFTPQEILLVLISVRGLSRPQGHSAIGRILCQ